MRTSRDSGQEIIIPELPLRQAPHKGTELIISLGWQRTNFSLTAALNLVGQKVLLEGRVKFWLEESKKEVQEIDCMSI